MKKKRKTFSMKYIEAFAEKHGTHFDRFIDPDNEVVRFINGNIFDISEIVFDIDRQIPAGTIEIYAELGLSGAITLTYENWYEERNQKTT